MYNLKQRKVKEKKKNETKKMIGEIAILLILMAITGVGYNALTSKEYIYGLLGNNGTRKIKATTIDTAIATI